MIKIKEDVIIITESDVHLQDRNRGQHKDYANTSLNEFRRTNDEIKKLIKQDKKVVVIQGGDLANRRFLDKRYEYEVCKILEERMKLTDGYSIVMQGNHDQTSYGMSERDFLVNLGLARDTENIETLTTNLYLVDYGKKYEDIIKGVDKNKKNIVLTHNQIQWKDSDMAFFGNDYTLLDDNKDFENIDLVIGFHIHKPIILEGEMYGGRKAKVIYQGCSARPSIDDKHKQGSWVLIDTKDGSYRQEFYDLPPMEEVFNEVQIEINNTKKGLKTIIGDILEGLEKYKIGGGDIKEIIRSMEVDKEVKEKALEFLEEGEEK